MKSELYAIRQKLSQGSEIVLLTSQDAVTQDITKAEKLKSDDNLWLLDNSTEFKIDGNNVPLRIIIHCWLHRNSNAADYLADCQAKNMINISFLQRNDLIRWLTGESDSSQYLESSKDDNLQDDIKVESEANRMSENHDSTARFDQTPARNIASSNMQSKDPILVKILSNERTLLDHNSSLRGNKPIDFGYLIKDVELKLVQSIKSDIRTKHNSQRNGTSHNISKSNSLTRTPRKDPIILIPSAASSIFTTSNVKKFLQDSQYISPRDLQNAQTPDLVTIEKKLERISKPIRFIVVDNTRMFTKPEYWDRVVAVFTTGHTWQFNNYQWNTPQELFQHCKGYYFHFVGDSIPSHVQQWNVDKIELEKYKRFKDVEVARYFWNSLEKELVARGYQ